MNLTTKTTTKSKETKLTQAMVALSWADGGVHCVSQLWRRGGGRVVVHMVVVVLIMDVSSSSSLWELCNGLNLHRERTRQLFLI